MTEFKWTVRLESSIFLCSNKFGIIDETIIIFVIHLKNRINHLFQFGIGEYFRRSMWRCILSQMTTFFDLKQVEKQG